MFLQSWFKDFRGCISKSPQSWIGRIKSGHPELLCMLSEQELAPSGYISKIWDGLLFFMSIKEARAIFYVGRYFWNLLRGAGDFWCSDFSAILGILNESNRRGFLPFAKTCIACCLFLAFVLTTFITTFIVNICTRSSRVFWPLTPCCLSSQTPSGKFGACLPQKRMSSPAKPQTQAFITASPAFGCMSLHQRLSSARSQVALALHPGGILGAIPDYPAPSWRQTEKAMLRLFPLSQSIFSEISLFLKMDGVGMGLFPGNKPWNVLEKKLVSMGTTT